jgi:hypothetical protein
MIPAIRRALLLVPIALALAACVSFLPYDRETPTDFVYWDAE